MGGKGTGPLSVLLHDRDNAPSAREYIGYPVASKKTLAVRMLARCLARLAGNALGSPAAATQSSGRRRDPTQVWRRLRGPRSPLRLGRLQGPAGGRGDAGAGSSNSPRPSWRVSAVIEDVTIGFSAEAQTMSRAVSPVSGKHMAWLRSLASGALRDPRFIAIRPGRPTLRRDGAGPGPMSDMDHRSVLTATEAVPGKLCRFAAAWRTNAPWRPQVLLPHQPEGSPQRGLGSGAV
jgi:hypothetical protein